MRELGIRIKGINLGRTGLDRMSKDLAGVIHLFMHERGIKYTKIKVTRRY